MYTSGTFNASISVQVNVDLKLRCLRAISRADVDDARRFILASMVELYVELNEAQTQRYEAALEQEGNEEVHEMVVTWEDALASKYAAGEASATRSNILRILKRRLDAVPAFVRQKLDAIQSLERLEEILDQAAVASSIDDLVLEP